MPLPVYVPSEDAEDPLLASSCADSLLVLPHPAAASTTTVAATAAWVSLFFRELRRTRSTPYTFPNASSPTLTGADSNARRRPGERGCSRTLSIRAALAAQDVVHGYDGVKERDKEALKPLVADGPGGGRP